MLENSGYCAICATQTTFRAHEDWLRDSYVCMRCGTLPRNRALVEVLNLCAANWRTLAVHESSPSMPYFAAQAPNYTASQYFPDVIPGTIAGGMRCENLENLSFADASFDIFITQDVLEHVFNPDIALREIQRVLRDGGVHIFTTPKHKDLPVSYARAVLEGGVVRHILEPTYHANPVGDGRSLVTWDFGRDFDNVAMGWAGYQLSTFVIRDRSRGIDGEYLDVFVIKKDDNCRILPAGPG